VEAILKKESLLSGIKVVELTTMITGPLAGMLLADLGADVVKIENPDGGDPFRSFRGGQYSPHFCAYNRNKRSVALDLRSNEGKRALERLIETSDVLIENFRPGVIDRLGFDDTKLIELNSRLIHCHISGFGASGPYTNRPAYDAVAQSLSGMSSLFLDPENPQITGPTISDNITGYYASQGILAALFGREKTGVGRRIDVNMLEATLAFMPDPFGYYTQMDIVSDPKLRARTSQSYAFRCGDEKLLTVHLSSQEKFWEQFVDVIARPDLLTHEKSNSRALRIENYDFVNEVASEIFARHPRSYWLEVLAKRDIPFAPVYDVVEVLADPQIRHLGTFSTVTHPAMGPLTAIRRPVLFDKSRDDQPQIPPPMLGEHTAEVLAELSHGRWESKI
jgi:formyl-CoA transferase